MNYKRINKPQLIEMYESSSAKAVESEQQLVAAAILGGFISVVAWNALFG